MAGTVRLVSRNPLPMTRLASRISSCSCACREQTTAMSCAFPAVQQLIEQLRVLGPPLQASRFLRISNCPIGMPGPVPQHREYDYQAHKAGREAEQEKRQHN